MGKIELNKMAPILKKVGNGILKTVKNKEFQKGIAVGVPSAIALTYEIRKLRKQTAENDALYKKALAKEHAIAKELKERTDISKERQDRLLVYDSALKKELQKLDEENRELKAQIRELEKKKAKE
ncbi:hypothetical protein [Ohessyouella blattaphilus]|uniref:Uncharacterized protein n=1 Tax=Ohessyouella blattaphilus TaxID=2949333 RepID=A0ABT1EIM8_9FIRM|nr:hypothetical protein [Ohessyouella blattaphilus]MCP1110553.1 hypothetical protein [Ohessyouella blattaphilus]MCR8563947.1 hypothetical protein [Ohessyouella blattaphilus]